MGRPVRLAHRDMARPGGRANTRRMSLQVSHTAAIVTGPRLGVTGAILALRVAKHRARTEKWGTVTMHRQGQTLVTLFRRAG